MKIMLPFAALAILSFVDASHAASISTKTMEARWLRLDAECKDGPGPKPSCRARDRLYREIEKRGACWFYSDWRVFPPDFRWHDCREPRPPHWKPTPP